MADNRNERISWFIHNATVHFKKALYIGEIKFTQPLLGEMETTNQLKPTGPVEFQSISLLLTEQEAQICHEIGGEGLECYLFNHHEPDGRFFKMRLKLKGPFQGFAAYLFVAPWEEVIAAGAIKANTWVHVYGSREGELVFLFVRDDLFDERSLCCL